MNRTVAAAAMGFRDQARRPLLLLLLLIVPTYTITRSIAITLPTPRQIGLPGGILIDTTMRAIHGAVMAGIAIAFVTARNDALNWPHRDRFNWPHLRPIATGPFALSRAQNGGRRRSGIQDGVV